MRIILTGGGTMGHVTPAIAIAEEIRLTLPQAKILFVGRTGGKENSIITKKGFDIATVDIEGLSRKRILENFNKIGKALSAFRSAKKIIKDFCPDVVLGTGGYVSWPVIFAAQKMNIPTAIHESNATPGITTRLLAGGCDKIFLSNEKAKEKISHPDKTLTVGTPVLREFLVASREKSRKEFGLTEDEIFIVSFGGSGGAERINETVLEVISKHSSKQKKVRHLHATGRKYYEAIREKISQYEKKGCKIIPFIENMPTALSAADIVICRSGALTLAEISAVGVASILIPSPNVTGNHQLINAQSYSRVNAAVIIEEKSLTAEELIRQLITLENDKFDRKNKAKNSKMFMTQNSAKIILKELISLKKCPK